MESLSDLFRNLGNSLELEEILSTLDQELRRLIRYDGLSVHLVDSTGLTTAYATGRDIAWLDTRDCQGILETVALERRPAVQNSSQEPCRNSAALWFPVEQPEKHADRVTAVLVLRRTGEGGFTDQDLGIVRAVAPKLASSIENARRYQRAAQLVESDPLTGLANVRSLFQRLDAELARARRCRNPLAVLQCSIDGFDRSGRLCSPSDTQNAFEKVALKLRESCREYDFTARSGDDLVLVLPGFRHEFLAEKCSTIRKSVEEAGMSAGLPLFVAIGAAFFPQDGTDAEDLLAAAAEQVTLARQLSTFDAG